MPISRWNSSGIGGFQTRSWNCYADTACQRLRRIRELTGHASPTRVSTVESYAELQTLQVLPRSVLR
ncbi:hypothetical protein [Streptomyces sp.]|uniref:hypothetical protein n=1 Tax=Streptomyces sp. TaxID=1931 RepID=UPI002F92FDA5